MDMEARQTSFMPGTPYMGANLRDQAAARQQRRGALIAWDVVAGKPAWTVDESLPVESGVLATAGGVVFYGTLDGWFKAVDASNGQPALAVSCSIRDRRSANQLSACRRASIHRSASRRGRRGRSGGRRKRSTSVMPLRRTATPTRYAT